MAEESKSDAEKGICGICDKHVFIAMEAAHIKAHFDDANTPEVTNDRSGGRRFNLHYQEYSHYTPYGQCLALSGYLNSDFPSVWRMPYEEKMRAITELSQIRGELANAIRKPVKDCLADFNAENNKITRILPLLFRDENYIREECEGFMRTINVFALANSI